MINICILDNTTLPSSHDINIVSCINDADIVLTSDITVITNILNSYPTKKIVVSCASCFVNHPRVFYMNNKKRDIDIINFKNNIGFSCINDIHINMSSPCINMESEAIMAVLFVGDIVSWTKMNKFIRTCDITKTNDSIRVVGDIGVHFTITITNNASTFYEHITVTTTEDGTFAMSPPTTHLPHSYHDRYGASIIQFLHDVYDGNRYYQQEMESVIVTFIVKNRRASACGRKNGGGG